MTFREKVEPYLDEIEVGFVIGFRKPLPGEPPREDLIWIPHTHGPTSKLGLAHHALRLVEADVVSQISINREMSDKLKKHIEESLNAGKDMPRKDMSENSQDIN